MFDLSFIELAFFAIVSIFVLDADDIPKLAKTLRGWINKFAELKYEITDTLNAATKELDIQETLKKIEEEKKQVEEELQRIVKELPKTTTSGDIIKFNNKTMEEEKIDNV